MATTLETFHSRARVESRGTRNFRKVPLEIFGPRSEKFSSSVLYMPGFAEVHWHSSETRELLAQKGIVSICPELRPGDRPEIIFTELLEHPYFQIEGGEGKRSVITHSNGIRSFAGEMTLDRLHHLEAHADDITICNGPLHKAPSLPLLLTRYTRSYMQSIIEGRFTEMAHDLPTAYSWIVDPNFLREVRQTQVDLATIECNVQAIAERYGAALNFIVDPDDRLCPPDDLVEWHDEFVAQLPDDPALHPKIHSDSNGHSPSYREPGKFALLVRSIVRRARALRRGYTPKTMRPFRLGSALPQSGQE